MSGRTQARAGGSLLAMDHLTPAQSLYFATASLIVPVLWIAALITRPADGARRRPASFLMAGLSYLGILVSAVGLQFSTSILLAEARGGIDADALETTYTATAAGLLAAVLALLGLLLARLLSARTAGVVRAELEAAEADRQRDNEHLAEAIRKALDARG